MRTAAAHFFAVHLPFQREADGHVQQARLAGLCPKASTSPRWQKRQSAGFSTPPLATLPDVPPDAGFCRNELLLLVIDNRYRTAFTPFALFRSIKTQPGESVNPASEK